MTRENLNMAQTPEERQKIAADWEAKLRGENLLVNLYDSRNQENWLRFVEEKYQGVWSEFALNAWLGLNRKQLHLKPLADVQELALQFAAVDAQNAALAAKAKLDAENLANTQRELAAKQAAEESARRRQHTLDAQGFEDNRVTPATSEPSVREKIHNLRTEKEQREQFKKELSDAQSHVELSTGGRVAWGATFAMRKQLNQQIRGKYPQWAGEVQDQ
jgi:hypothetical protein